MAWYQKCVRKQVLDWTTEAIEKYEDLHIYATDIFGIGLVSV